jgi:anti-anti-sigma factor
VVHQDLYWESHEAFSGKCQELLACEDAKLVIDLTEVGFVFSTYLGILGNVFVEAKEKDKDLVLRVSRRIEWIFQLAGFKEMLTIEVVE